MDTYNLLFKLAFVLYLLSALSFVVFFILIRNRIAILSVIFVILGFSVHTVCLIMRTINLKHFPITSFYESLSFFSWTIVLAYILIQLKKRYFVHGVFILPLVVFLTGGALFLDSQIKPLPPSLKSYWLVIHGSLCFLSYACFVLSCIFGIMYLMQEREVKYKRINGLFFRLPSLESLDSISYRTVIFGFLFLSFGIITGSVWAQKAWGSFWNWDPKEVWSLVLWLIYVAYLHGRLMRGWQGRRSAYLAIIGFLVMLFTYLGVSLILPGLHSYL